jgi:hypothetical protein
MRLASLVVVAAAQRRRWPLKRRPGPAPVDLPASVPASLILMVATHLRPLMSCCLQPACSILPSTCHGRGRSIRRSLWSSPRRLDPRRRRPVSAAAAAASRRPHRSAPAASCRRRPPYRRRLIGEERGGDDWGRRGQSRSRVFTTPRNNE